MSCVKPFITNLSDGQLNLNIVRCAFVDANINTRKDVRWFVDEALRESDLPPHYGGSLLWLSCGQSKIRFKTWYKVYNTLDPMNSGYWPPTPACVSSALGGS
ncbi:hypothetical protein HPP92_013414 [Vanilla planifolia]|uniref:Uncharacterized protein n=1 Tax=Vanilla planifolia TaxID=51239 RepID=A0A835UWM8_VANPL|nr:hypothetical protein HPP92_013414 [Vanilla planifolia]